jgi:putative tricarboxylic transport membrane protein
MNVDRIFGAAVCILALLFLTLAVPSIPNDWQHNADAYYSVGPRLFPYIAGTLCLLLGLGVIIHPEGHNKLSGLRDRKARGRVAASFALTLAYMALLDVVGFTLSTIIALVLFFTVFGERRWYVIVPMAVGVAVITKFVFLKFFLLELPTGLFDLPV